MRFYLQQTQFLCFPAFLQHRLAQKRLCNIGKSFHSMIGLLLLFVMGLNCAPPPETHTHKKTIEFLKPSTSACDLIWNKVIANIMSRWGRSRVGGALIQYRGGGWPCGYFEDTHTGKDWVRTGHWGDSPTQQGPREARRDPEQLLPQSPRNEPALQTTWFGTSTFQNCETTNFSCCESSSLWYFITATLENEYIMKYS